MRFATIALLLALFAASPPRGYCGDQAGAAPSPQTEAADNVPTQGGWGVITAGPVLAQPQIVCLDCCNRRTHIRRRYYYPRRYLRRPEYLRVYLHAAGINLSEREAIRLGRYAVNRLARLENRVKRLSTDLTHNDRQDQRRDNQIREALTDSRAALTDSRTALKLYKILNGKFDGYIAPKSSNANLDARFRKVWHANDFAFFLIAVLLLIVLFIVATHRRRPTVNVRYLP